MSGCSRRVGRRPGDPDLDDTWRYQKYEFDSDPSYGWSENR